LASRSALPAPIVFAAPWSVASGSLPASIGDALARPDAALCRTTSVRHSRIGNTGFHESDSGGGPMRRSDLVGISKAGALEQAKGFKSASHRLGHLLGWIQVWKGVSQAQSGGGGRRGPCPLLSRMPVDSTTAHLRNGIASAAHARNGGAKSRRRPHDGRFMRRSSFWKRGPGRRDYFSFAYSALASFRMGMPGSASFQSVRKS
jgi:hypothetical protein